MRLLEILQNGDVRLTDDLPEAALPPYAILSHRWGAASEEVSFADMRAASGQSKAGYKKIEFCSHRAHCDGLAFLWVDSCCIDKSHAAELSLAIRSMFRWYRNAARCYVYLQDVSTDPSRKPEETQSAWEPAFRSSSWFTRGWTLQELIAPVSVEFFSKEGQRLGDRTSFREDLHRITNIPASALDGVVLSDFTVNERMSWAAHRHTTVKEDKAYSLLGIFGVSLNPISNEGEANAFRRLKEEIDKAEQCMQAVHCTDPRKDKKRIEEGKDGLLKGSYQWVLDHPDFRRWRDKPDCSLLWVKGDPGKGKTMLLSGIIDELSAHQDQSRLLAFFYCQASDGRLNNATAVLRGLVYMLLTQQPSLTSYVQQQADRAGYKIFEDVNAWVAVSDIFMALLQDTGLPTTYLVVDALDECSVDLPKLLDLVAQLAALNPRVKILVSSRNWFSIEERLERAQTKTLLSLELNEQSISSAVDVFVRHKVDDIAQQKRLDNKTKDAIFDYLSANAQGTFLWVSLVCQNLRSAKPWSILTKLRTFPAGLDGLYKRMMDQIEESEDSEICKRILATAVLVYRPVTLYEATCLIDLPEAVVENLTHVKDLIGLCGSFLTVRNSTIYLVHQSAKDYLLGEAASSILPDGEDAGHHQLHLKSLNTLNTVLIRDMYGLGDVSCSIEDVQVPVPDPLIACRYSMIHWADHLGIWAYAVYGQDQWLVPAGKALSCFINDKYLYWLEALSLTRSLSDGVQAIAKLRAVIPGRSSMLESITDAWRFILYFKEGIARCPLQTYVAPFIFSPRRSHVAGAFRSERPLWLSAVVHPPMVWSAQLATLEGHGGAVGSIAFSPVAHNIASASADRTIRIWSYTSGAQLVALKGHRGTVCSISFSPDGRNIVSASADGTIVLWDCESGEHIATLWRSPNPESHSYCVAYSRDGQTLAFGSSDYHVRLLDFKSTKEPATLAGHRAVVSSVAFSRDGTRLVSGAADSKHFAVMLWDCASKTLLMSLCPGEVCRSVAFSPNGEYVACGFSSGHRTLKILDTKSGVEETASGSFSKPISSLAFSPDGKRVVLGFSYDYDIVIRDIQKGVDLSVLRGTGTVNSVAVSPSGNRIASSTTMGTLEIWDAYQKEDRVQHLDSAIVFIALSPDRRRVVSGSQKGSVRYWDADSGSEVKALERVGNYPNNMIHHVAFSPNSRWFACASASGIETWDCESVTNALKLYRSRRTESVTFSPDGSDLAAGQLGAISIFDAESGTEVAVLDQEMKDCSAGTVLFSPDGSSVACSCLQDGTFKVWDLQSKTLRAILRDPKAREFSVGSIAFSVDGRHIASAWWDQTAFLWDAESGAPILSVGRDEISFVKFQLATGERRRRVTTDMIIRPQIPIVQHRPTSERWCIESKVALSVSDDWILHEGRKILWLPPEYRGWHSVVDQDRVFIGHTSGKLGVYRFNLADR